MNKRLQISGLAVAMLFSSGLVLAAEPATTQQKTQAQVKDQSRVQERQTTGSKLMTDEERNEQRIKMRSSATQEERDAVRAEHHEKMKQRAADQGTSLPATPPAKGGGMGGMGSGQGGGQGRWNGWRHGRRHGRWSGRTLVFTAVSD